MWTGVSRRAVPLPARGVTLSVLDWGGRGPLALLHHANGYCAALWAPVAERLRDRFRVMALDARGHGESSKPPPGDAYLWPEFGSDLAALAEVLAADAGRVAVGVGHSFGGTATLLAAAWRPELFERIVLLDPVILPSSATPPELRRAVRGSEMAEGARRRRQVFPDRASARERWQGRSPVSSWTPRAFDLYVEHGLLARADGGVELACAGEVEAAIYERGASVDAIAEARGVRCPALVLRASRGDFPRATYEALVRAMPDAELRDVDTGHFVPMEDPELVAREVLAFSARPGASAASSRPSPPPATPRS
jgi:pimeloyl-ACP methyl ester carboxylesterase